MKNASWIVDIENNFMVNFSDMDVGKLQILELFGIFLKKT